MRYLRFVALLGICLGSASFANAQRVFVGVGVGPSYLGPAPVCAYGYYGYYPYACAPYGYYGPDYFVGGVFIGAGPWFHGFYGRPRFYGRPGFYGRGFERRERSFHERREFDRGGFRGAPGEGFRGDRGREFRGGGPNGRGFHGGGIHSGRR